MSAPALSAVEVFNEQQDALRLQWVAGEAGQARLLEAPDARFPGMALVGYLNFVHPHRVQVLARKEITYLDELPADQRAPRIAQIAKHPDSVMVIVAQDEQPPADLVVACNEHGTALLNSMLPAASLINDLQFYLARRLAERLALHGVFMDVMDVGVLLEGDSGIGKSECALELLTRNHRLVADDVVEIYKLAPGELHGRCPHLLNRYMEVRGLGILNVGSMFGESSILREKRLDLIVRLEQATPERLARLDRLHGERRIRSLLEVDIPQVVVLVAPGRNLAVIVEAAARHHLLRMRGINPLQEFISEQDKLLREKARQSAEKS
ncbi:MAG: HPr(Ser) kinase/phosphatase [Gammaproteobacteria bacterium]|nr:HPr(Ser) kinase/phosphatase [Gammaproteobacteria bacterium]